MNISTIAISAIILASPLNVVSKCTTSEASQLKVVDAIKNNDGNALLAFIDSHGFTMGTDGEEMTVSQLRHDFSAREKNSAYCELFVCEGKSTSVRSAIVSGSQHKENISPTEPGTASYSYVSKDIKVTINFIRRHCKWYISSIEYI